MRILFSTRSNYESQPGGDTLHLLQTAKALRSLGHEVNIWEGEKIDFKQYQVLHHFNLGRPAPALQLVASGLPLVISSIYVDYSAADSEASSLRRFLQQGLGSEAMEYVKLLGRALQGREKWPPLEYLLNGQRASVLKVVQKAECLLTATEAEAQLIQKSYPHFTKTHSLKLGIEHLKIQESTERHGLLSIARFEPIKNQLNLVKALTGANWPSKMVGEAAPAHQDYRKTCEDQAEANISFEGRATREQCAQYYAQAKVHVLASHYESTGLVSLEALASGCQIVVSDHPIQRELFGDRAHYCDPMDPISIRAAIEAAFQDQREHRKWVLENFSWAKAAQKLESIYQDIVPS